MTQGHSIPPERLLGRLRARCLDLANAAGFGLRERIGFRRGGYREGPCELGLNDRGVRELVARFALDPLLPHLAPATLDAAIFFVEVLERALRARDTALPPELDVLDVGAKNFESALGLHAVLSGAKSGSAARVRDVRLTGSEIDAFRVYDTLHSRADAAEYYLSLLPSSRRGAHRYLPGDILAVNESFDVVTWFHPFLSPRPLLHWGLPRRLLMPERLLDHVLDRVRPGGILVIVNQEEYESRIQAALLDARGVVRDSYVHDLSHTRRQARAFVHVVPNA